MTLREKLLPQAAFVVRFVKDERFPLAEVRFGDVVVQHGTPPDHNPPIRQEAVLSHPVFITLGDLWQTTQAYRSKCHSARFFAAIRRRRKSSQAAAFRPNENTAELRQEPTAAFPNQSHTQRARLGRQTPGSLVRINVYAPAVPAAGPPPTFLKEIDHGPSHAAQPGAE